MLLINLLLIVKLLTQFFFFLILRSIFMVKLKENIIEVIIILKSTNFNLTYKRWF